MRIRNAKASSFQAGEAIGQKTQESCSAHQHQSAIFYSCIRFVGFLKNCRSFSKDSDADVDKARLIFALFCSAKSVSSKGKWIAVHVVSTTFVLRLKKKNKLKEANKFDAILAQVLLLVYVVLNLYFIFNAMR